VVVVPRSSPISAQGEFLVAGVVDGLGQGLLGLGDKAGQGVQSRASWSNLI
jgi:hypothetical protein